jgi:DNA-binding response OmpR family regulator
MPTIVIVYLEKNILTTLRMAFENAGFVVHTFADTSRADEFIATPPDIYILPRRGGPLSGVALFKRIRESNSSVPVVFLSANPEAIAKELSGTGLEPEAYIEVPFSQRQVVQRVRDLLGMA